jgi:hypothetical protein
MSIPNIINTYSEGIRVKAKLTIAIEEELIPKAKKYARSKGVSLSQLIEQILRELSEGQQPSFADRWRGKLRAANRPDARYRRLMEKHL